MTVAPKRSSLFGTAPTRPPAEPETMSEAAPASTESTASAPRYPKARTREGKRVATCYLEREALRQLQQIALDEETTIQALLVEGVNAVFQKRGHSRIA